MSHVLEIQESLNNGQFKQATNQINEFLETHTIAELIDIAQSEGISDEDILKMLRRVVL